MLLQNPCMLPGEALPLAPPGPSRSRVPTPANLFQSATIGGWKSGSFATFLLQNQRKLEIAYPLMGGLHGRVEFGTQDDEADASTSREAQELVTAAQTLFRLAGAPPLHSLKADPRRHLGNDSRDMHVIIRT